MILPQQPTHHCEEADQGRLPCQAHGHRVGRERETSWEGQQAMPGRGKVHMSASAAKKQRTGLMCRRAELSRLSRPKHYPSANVPQAHCPAWLG